MSLRVHGLRRALRRPQLRVDAGDVEVDVVQQAPPARPGAAEHARLARDLGLRLRARRERPQAREEGDRAEVRRVDRREARVGARLLEEQSPVLRDDPPGRPGEVVDALGGDVRDVELVAHDADAGARGALDPARALALRPELLRLEVPLEVAARDVVELRRQRVVHARLPVGPRRDGHGALLAGGDDVQRRRREVGRGAGGDGWQQQAEGRDGKRRTAQGRGHGAAP